MEEELLLVTSPNHPLARKKRIVAQDLRGQHFILFESGSNTRRALDEFFLRENIEPTIVMETENVEIIKALVRTNLGITIISFQSVAREFASHQLFCARITGQELVRRTGWVYAKANRVPRAVQEVMAAFEHIRPRLKLSLGGSRFRKPAPSGPPVPAPDLPAPAREG
jgi:DNA-binding transcriptional LysR family regulator